MTEEPKLWRDMLPEEKGALLLAHHEGKKIEANVQKASRALKVLFLNEWVGAARPRWEDDYAYRIKPEPTRDTIKLYISNGLGMRQIGTIDTIDGEPDSASIKIKKV